MAGKAGLPLTVNMPRTNGIGVLSIISSSLFLSLGGKRRPTKAFSKIAAIGNGNGKPAVMRRFYDLATSLALLLMLLCKKRICVMCDAAI
jgi:hypothetical protein